MFAAAMFALMLSASCKDGASKQEVYVSKFNFMDTTVSPKQDFYQFVNGAWLSSTEIPDDETRWGSFDELRENTNQQVLAIMKKAAAEPISSLSANQAKAVYLYKSFMDTTARNAAGITPLQPTLDQIAAIQSVGDLQTYLMERQRSGKSGIFSFSVRSDFKDSNRHAAYIGSPGFGLPDRDYYLKDDDDAKDKRAKYVAHVTRMLRFLGDSEADAAAQAERILAFETRLAPALMDRAESRDARKRNNPRSIDQLAEMVPQIDWKAYFDGIGAAGLDTVIVSELKYVESLKDVLRDNELDNWKTLLRWSALNHAAGLLTMDMERADWEFYSRTMNGAKSQKPLEERALSVVNGVLGEALGQLYVKEHFPPEAKAAAREMIDKVVKAYDTRIKALTWMTADTKTKALEKLHRLSIKIGYPDEWRDYSTMDIKAPEDGGSYYANRSAASTWNFEDNVSRLSKPVDKTEWRMSPQTVNAYYNGSHNEIVFPAAILQPPFYHYQADPAVNFGGIGAVIGHEISHGFDDSGSRFDADGNLKNWWTDEDREAFDSLGQGLADQYGAIEVIDGIRINGKLSLGENIGDLGGTNAALDGLRLWIAEKGDPGLIDGFTQEQRFFISWANIWRVKYRDEAMIRQLKIGPHAPGNYRGWVPIRNLDAFHEAFGTSEGDAMYLTPESRIKIW